MTRLLRFIFRSIKWMLSSPLRYLGLGLVVLLGVAAALGYLYRESIVEAYTSAQDAVLSTLGLGVILVALWLVAFLVALALRRSALKRFNLWVGALAFIAAIEAGLAFFHPDTGALGAFALDGEVSLGGRTGEAIVGTADWVGALRALGAFALASLIAFPRLTLDLVARSGKLFMIGYVLVVVAAKGGVSWLTRMYRFQPATGQSDTSHVRAESEADPPWLTDTQGRVARWPTNVTVSSKPLPTSVEIETGTATVVASEPDVDQSEEKLPEDGSASVEHRESGESEGGAGKFNKFWSSTEAAANGQSRMSHVQAAEEDDGEAGPITSDPAEAWKLPPRDLLVDASEGGISEEAMAETAETIKRTLAEYAVEVQTGQIRPGPAVTMYGLIPGWVRRYKQERELDESGKPKLDQSGRPIATRVESKTRVKVDSILSREKDLALALKTPRIRIETPVMGKSQVGVEVPNPSLALVTLRNVMEGKEFQRLRTRAKLPIALGKASGGETVVVDLAKMPHLLVAGATGSGKSVFINTVVSSLIMERSPAEVRLLLVDPKRVELTPYNGIPHLLTPVVVETDQVIGLLKGLIHEMFSRYKRMEEIGVRNIDGYNRKMPDKIPYIVVAVDELADLMMTAAFDVEQSICRLAQLGRATGIHLVVATQRPSVDVVTGLIKANFPSRVSFGVTSQIDSRTILDTVGAEKLLGRGDMLYQAQDASRPERIQGVFISDAEIERVVNFWQTTTWRPLHALSLRAVGTEETEADERVEDRDARGSSDELLQKATELAQHYNKMSTSLLQRRLRIGYPRAARLMDQLEERGIIGPSDGSKSRDVIINRT